MTYNLKELQTLLEKINPKVDGNRILMGYPENLTQEQVVHYLVTNIPRLKNLCEFDFTEKELTLLVAIMEKMWPDHS